MNHNNSPRPARVRTRYYERTCQTAVQRAFDVLSATDPAVRMVILPHVPQKSRAMMLNGDVGPTALRLELAAMNPS